MSAFQKPEINDRITSTGEGIERKSQGEENRGGDWVHSNKTQQSQKNGWTGQT